MKNEKFIKNYKRENFRMSECENERCKQKIERLKEKLKEYKNGKPFNCRICPKVRFIGAQD